MPPQDPRTRPGSRPDALDGLLDQQPERLSVNHDGVDGVPQRPPRRTATLPMMAALRAPPIISQPETGLPTPPALPLPLELAPTKFPPLPWNRTVRAPSPPPLVAASRRTDPPSDQEPTAVHRPRQDTLRESPAPPEPSLPPSSSLPPASQDPNSATHAALRRELAKVKEAAEKAETAKHQAELELAAKIAADEAAAKKAKPNPETIWGLPLRNALIAFMAAVTTLGAPAAVWLTARAESAKQEAERQKIITAQLQQKAAEEQAAKSKTTTDLAASKAELVAQRVYYREVFRLMGVEIPKHPGDPDPNDLKPMTPLCPSGKVCSGPQLVISVAP